MYPFNNVETGADSKMHRTLTRKFKFSLFAHYEIELLVGIVRCLFHFTKYYKPISHKSR